MTSRIKNVLGLAKRRIRMTVTARWSWNILKGQILSIRIIRRF